MIFLWKLYRTFSFSALLIADFLLQTNYNNAQSVDKNFFTESSLAAHSKGRASMPGSDHTGGVESNFRGSTSTLNDEAKPWKKHNKKNKREKLRRVYAHLDQ